MPQNTLTYPEYLQLPKLLSCQHPLSQKTPNPAHDEMLFITAHQAHELWFKQLIYELNFLFEEKNLTHSFELSCLLNRLIKIFELMNAQMSLLETISPIDFLAFRTLLGNASGFQSQQFHELVSKLGLQSRTKMNTPSLTLKNYMNKWLRSLKVPFPSISTFKHTYLLAVEKYIADELLEPNNPPTAHHIHSLNTFQQKIKLFFYHEKLSDQNTNDFCHESLVKALIIYAYKEHPGLRSAYECITQLILIDQAIYTWRQKHLFLVERILGFKPGSGGSSGHEHLSVSLNSTRIFNSLSYISSFLIPPNYLLKISSLEPVFPTGHHLE